MGVVLIRSDEEGVLAEFHERSSQGPLSVILVDEVEKAHPHLRKFFLSLMDRGAVTDNRGRTLFFANSMLRECMTPAPTLASSSISS